MAKGGTPIGRLSRRILAAAFVMLSLTVAAAAFFASLTRSVDDRLLEAQLSSGAPEAPLNHLADALVWGQTAAVIALSLLTAGLFALAWYLRTELSVPLEALRRSLAATAAGALAEKVSGLERKDEIGAAARAAERLRQTALDGEEAQGFQGLKQLLDHVSKDAGRLEADLAVLLSATGHARTQIEEASIRAAKASHAAIEAASLVRDHVGRMANPAGEGTAAPDRPGIETDLPEIRLASDAEADAVLSSLASDLGALERFARERRTIAGDSAAAVTVALIEAIDRLNGVAERIAAAADLNVKDEAA